MLIGGFIQPAHEENIKYTINASTKTVTNKIPINNISLEPASM